MSQSDTPLVVTKVVIDEADAGQRLDNYLIKRLKGVPKSRIYRIIRGGEVRVNGKRVEVDQRLEDGDEVRIPPVRVAERPAGAVAPPPPVQFDILYEDDAILAVNKPAGLAVHGGSGISHGVIEQLRHQRPQAKFLELVHRLDRDTSGVLLLAKKRSALTRLHELIRDGKTDKRYLVLALGEWSKPQLSVKAPLLKYVMGDGERRVRVEAGGQASHTVFRLQRRWAGYALLEAELKTGRTHQIRVHLAHVGHPIAGDDKYGDFSVNRLLTKRGLKRMFLHAARISFPHPLTGESLTLEAPLAPELQAFLNTLDRDTNG